MGAWVEDIAQSVEQRALSLQSSLFDPVIRLGVTGLSRAGKTVFITSLVANLLNRGRMAGLSAEREGRILAAYLDPQPDDRLARFAYETHLDAMTGAGAHWPQGTSGVSQLRLSLRIRPKGVLGGIIGPRRVHIDIVDYPGEWLLDLGLMGQDYAEWSAQVLARIAARASKIPQAADFLAAMAQVDATQKHDEPQAKALCQAYCAYLMAARDAGFSDCSPGRFLLPGDLADSPALTFAPFPKPAQAPPKGSVLREAARRYAAYKTHVVRPFFRDHFAKIDRQVVLVDVLGAVHAGPEAVEEMRRAMAGILGVFRHGQNGPLAAFLGRRVDRILFAATKADYLHHRQHPHLTALIEAALAQARDRAAFAGARTGAMAISALRCTIEETRAHNGTTLDMVRGWHGQTGKQAALYAGALPKDPEAILGPARGGAQAWLDADFAVMDFAPAPDPLRRGEGPPHIRLDAAAEFLLGDRL